MKKQILTFSLLINLIFVAFLIRHFFLSPIDKPIKGITYYHHRNNVLDKLSVDSNSIVFGGDSHIQQFELAELFHTLNVKNRGIDYDTSIGLLNRVDELTNGHPAKIFIEIGENDIRQGDSLDNITNHIEALLKSIKTMSPKSKVYLLSVIPNKHDLYKILNFNNKLAFIAKSHQITYIDLNPYFLDNGLKSEYNSGDGVHLNSAGYFKLRDILKPYLQ